MNNDNKKIIPEERPSIDNNYDIIKEMKEFYDDNSIYVSYTNLDTDETHNYCTCREKECKAKTKLKKIKTARINSIGIYNKKDESTRTIKPNMNLLIHNPNHYKFFGIAYSNLDAETASCLCLLSTKSANFQQLAINLKYSNIIWT